MKNWTMAEAKADFERGLLKGCSIYFHDVMGLERYTVSLDAALALEGSGDLVDARTHKVREFKTMDAAHSAIRQIGFETARFRVNLK